MTSSPSPIYLFLLLFTEYYNKLRSALTKKLKTITLIVGCHHTNEEIDGCCSESKRCGYNQGSCASNAECIDGLACVLCDKKSQFPRGTKCCRIVDDDNSIAADSLFVGQGPCNYDWECFGTLICGNIHDTHIDCNSPTIPDHTRCCKRKGFTYIFIQFHMNFGSLYTFLINCFLISFRNKKNFKV